MCSFSLIESQDLVHSLLGAYILLISLWYYAKRLAAVRMEIEMGVSVKRSRVTKSEGKRGFESRDVVTLP